MSVSKKVKSQGLKFGIKAMSKIMESPDRADTVMKAFQTVQRSKEAVDEATHTALNLSRLPSRDDIKELGRRTGRLRRQAKKILADLDALEAADNS